MRERLRSAARWSVETYLVFVVVGVIVGGLLTPFALGATNGADGTVAVVAVDGSIDGEQFNRYEEAMSRARAEADAVVVIANSGGGSASASEAMYLQTKRTGERMPVVTVVSAAAASGAYYTILPSDRIYVKPASIVGSVGVVAQVPPAVEPNDLVGTTGPDKLTGGAGRGFFYRLDAVQGAFLNAVFANRGDRLTLDRSEVAHATTFTGVSAVRNGLADGIGDRQRAIKTAAELAGLERPRVVVYGDGGAERTFLLRSTYLASGAEQKRLIDGGPFLARSDGLPTILMVPPGAVADGGQLVWTTGGSYGTDPADNGSAAATPDDGAAPRLGPEGAPGVVADA